MRRYQTETHQDKPEQSDTTLNEHIRTDQIQNKEQIKQKSAFEMKEQLIREWPEIERTDQDKEPTRNWKTGFEIRLKLNERTEQNRSDRSIGEEIRTDQRK